MANKNKPGSDSGDTGVVTETQPKSKEKLGKPPLFKVLFHNDN